MQTKPSFFISLFAIAWIGLSAASHADDRVDVVASFSILGDMVQHVGGERVQVTTLVGANGNGHVYQPTPADAKAVAKTKLLVINGLGFEGWIERLIEASGYTGKVVTTTTGVKLLKSANDHHHGHGNHHDDVDPHAWHSLKNAKIYIRNIVAGLIAVDPVGAATYRSNAAHYLKEMDVVEAQMQKSVAVLPAEQRKVVTSHDAFGYFAAAYGIQFLSPIGFNTEAEAAAADIAKLIRQIKQENIAAVFLENVSDRRLIDQIVRETGARIGGILYSGALSTTDEPAATYLDMMRHNMKTLVTALNK